MKTRIPFLSVVSLLFLLSACATTPPFHHLEEAARSQVSDVDVFLIVPQKEIYAQIDQSNVAAATGGGLLMALIDAAVDSSRTKTAEQIIQPIRDKLLNFDYADELGKEINTTLKNVGWLHARDIQLVRTTTDEKQTADLYAKSKASAVLFVSGNYSLTPNFHSVVTQVSLTMYPKSAALNTYKESDDKNSNPMDGTDNIYRNHFEYSTVLTTDPNMKKEDAAAAVAAASPGKLVDGLTDNARKIARMIGDDLMIGSNTAAK